MYLGDIGVVLAVLLIAVLIFQGRRKNALPYPPGPKALPIIGNLTDMAAKSLWHPATRWAKQFGMFCVLSHVFGQGIVFVNTSQAATELLDKKGSIYSDKPNMVMARELVGLDGLMVFTGYGDQFRRQRRLMQRAVGPQVVSKYHPMLEVETKAFLRRLLTSPENYTEHLIGYAGGKTLMIVYGHQVKSSHDPLLALADEGTDIIKGLASGIGIWPVDVVPALKSLPNWFPGAGFKRNAVYWKRRMQDFVDVPFQSVLTAVNNGTALPSFCSLLLDGDTSNTEEHYDIKWLSSSMYSASIDTTLTMASLFILAMVLNPRVLKKAQAEIDTVVGTKRLPLFSDRASLPYIDAIMSETFRWGCPVPLSIPHRLMEDDVYEGKFIPKGSLIFANIWAMVRDETLYPNPEEFLPERFLADDDELLKKRKNPRNFVFGFGRRRCPGANLVEQSIWILIASMIAALDISKAQDEKGAYIEPEIIFDDNIFRLPKPFKLSVKVRSKQAEQLLEQA
ncbi:cytochrome P450 [Gymnopilus junonius]|uniref:Cytochrome P450 n=1 Tax=Gymnopilus junonius TaxID=109634 RepID=A0A9P5NU79_GYMJU|nr:cytochrome P450 [Gymnopilus junonius]